MHEKGWASRREEYCVLKEQRPRKTGSESYRHGVGGKHRRGGRKESTGLGGR